MKTRPTRILAAVLGFLGLVFAVAWIWAHHHRLVVVNASGKDILRLTITVGREDIVFDNLAPGARVSSAFNIRGDDHFAVTGKFAHGGGFDGNYGYVTSGLFAQRACFVIKADGSIQVRQSGGI